MKKKKIYNPFMMIGSYIGVLIGIFIGVFLNMNTILNRYHFAYTINHLVDYNIGGFFTYFEFNCILFAFIGFFLGWGIHSLVRKMRK